jgi:hypothetical protein
LAIVGNARGLYLLVNLNVGVGECTGRSKWKPTVVVVGIEIERKDIIRRRKSRASTEALIEPPLASRTSLKTL